MAGHAAEFLPGAHASLTKAVLDAQANHPPKELPDPAAATRVDDYFAIKGEVEAHAEADQVLNAVGLWTSAVMLGDLAIEHFDHLDQPKPLPKSTPADDEE